MEYEENDSIGTQPVDEPGVSAQDDGEQEQEGGQPESAEAPEGKPGVQPVEEDDIPEAGR